MSQPGMKTLTTLTLLLALALAIVSFCGGFLPGTYARDAASMAAQGRGQDLVNLFLAVPLLLGSLLLMRRGGRAALLVYGGTVFYVLYSFVIYAFGVHFNRLFLLYCLILGLSLYAFIVFMQEANHRKVETWFGAVTPVRTTAAYLLAVAALFYLLWLKDTLPAVLADTVPTTVSDYGLLVNPVHVIDMAVVLPGLILIARLLLKRRRLGFILAPLALAFTVILAIALAAMVVAVKVEGIAEDLSIAFIFTVLALISTLILVLMLRNLKRSTGE